MEFIGYKTSMTCEDARASKKGMLMYVRDLRLGKFPRVKGKEFDGDVYGAHALAPECS